MSDVLDMLEADHRRVERLLEELANSDEGAERETAVEQLVTALAVHMQFEESAIYPLLRQLDQEMEEEAENEHTLTRDGVTKLREFVAEPGFGAVVDMLKGGIGHHVTEEETAAFPKLRTSCDDDTLSDLADQLLSAKRDAGLTEMDLRDATKEQLLQMAREVDLEGRSSMSADELRAALSRPT